VTDNRAVAHLLSNHMTYYKPETTRFQLSYLLGNGQIFSRCYGRTYSNDSAGLISAEGQLTWLGIANFLTFF
jgi:hypothetical protein